MYPCYTWYTSSKLLARHGRWYTRDWARWYEGACTQKWGFHINAKSSAEIHGLARINVNYNIGFYSHDPHLNKHILASIFPFCYVDRLGLLYIVVKCAEMVNKPTSSLQNLGIAIEIACPALAFICVCIRIYYRLLKGNHGWGMSCCSGNKYNVVWDTNTVL